MNRIFLLRLFILSSIICSSQNNNGLNDIQFNTNRCYVTTETYMNICYKPLLIHGGVYEADSGHDFIPFAQIHISGTQYFCFTDSVGNYSLEISTLADSIKAIEIICTFVNHEPKIISLSKPSKTTTIDFYLLSPPMCNMPDISITKKPIRKLKRQKTKTMGN